MPRHTLALRDIRKGDQFVALVDVSISLMRDTGEHKHHKVICRGDLVNVRGLARYVGDNNVYLQLQAPATDPHGMTFVFDARQAGHILNAPGFFPFTKLGGKRVRGAPSVKQLQSWLKLQ